MATTSEHYQRARAAMLGASEHPDEDDVERMLAAARPHLVGWLTDELAETSGRIRLSLRGFHDASLQVQPGEHVWSLSTLWRLGPLDMLGAAATLDHSRLLHAAPASCALCNRTPGETAGWACHPANVE